VTLTFARACLRRIWASPRTPPPAAQRPALAGYILPSNPEDGVLRWTIHQGVEMGRPSVIFLEADVAAGAITAIRVGGASVLVSEGTLTLPG
jgi:trans-2,3-dihydro-3-hydroxyanthranilate isomerase